MTELNYVSICFLGIYLLQYAASVGIQCLNVSHLRNNADKIPEVLAGFVDSERLARINAYSVANSRISLIHKTVVDAFVLGLIVMGFLSLFDSLARTHQLNYMVAGLIFFLALGTILFVLNLPFDYYQTFVIEETYGFNRSDLKTWVLDHAKAFGLSTALLVVVLLPILWVITVSPYRWWLYAFLMVSLVQLVLVLIYPVVIAPLFNKFEPLADRVLAEKVESLLTKSGMRPRGIFQMDAGRRSSHSNAYVTGLGRTKRIVLFDTLIDSHPREEILGVLAHEIGHAKLRHVLKSYLLGQVAAFGGLYVTYLMLNWELLLVTFGISGSQSYLGLFVIGIFWQKAGYFLRPISMALSRRFEEHADFFAATIQQSGEPLADALKRMASHNLSNVRPHPLYVRFNYSHPPIVERIERLER